MIDVQTMEFFRVQCRDQPNGNYLISKDPYKLCGSTVGIVCTEGPQSTQTMGH